MSSHDDLGRRLDTVGRDGWEDAYAGCAVELSGDQEYALVTSERPWAEWLAFRFCAGPPGVPLPAYTEALAAVLHGETGTPRDAYRVVLAPPHPLPEEAPTQLALGILTRSMACALKHGTTWFATWLAARVALAALALGRPDITWRILDGLSTGGQRHPHLDKVAMFGPLRGHAALESSEHVRAAIRWLWPELALPMLPRLPAAAAPQESALAATLGALEKVGAVGVHEFVWASVCAADRATMDEHANDPLVRELSARAMDPGSDAPAVDAVPPWFSTWARAVTRSHQPHLARLAGLVLHRSGGTDPGFAAMLVLLAARARDLAMLAASFGEPEMQSMIDELAQAATALPAEAANALVALAWPHHVDADLAPMVLIHHLDALERLPTRPGGFVEHVIATTRSIAAERARDISDAAPAYEGLVARVRRSVARLHDGGLVSGPEVERAALAVEVTALTAGLFDSIATPPSALSPMEALVLALAMRRAVTGTEHEAHWRPMFALAASDAIYELRLPTLFGLRLALLDELISTPHRLVALSKLHFQRANTRRTLAPTDRSETDRVLADLRAAIDHARTEGDGSRCAAATASWVQIIAWLDAGGESNPPAFADAGRLLDQALALVLEPRDQALLHQAHAHLLRRRDPEAALAAHQRALAIVPPEEPHAVEVAAELVSALVRLHRFKEAADRGLAFLDAASSRTKATELGMLHLTVGEALVALDRHGDARPQLEAGLQLVRGREPQNEALAHLQLARLGLASGDLGLTREHLRWLNDRGDQLDRLIRSDVHTLEAILASEAGTTGAQRAALRDAISLAADDTQRARLRLQLARLDLSEKLEVPDLDGVLVDALGLAGNGDLDHVILEIITDLAIPLSARALEDAMRWSTDRRRPDVVAKLHYRAGRADAARGVLRAALASDLSDKMRLACVHQLVVMLEADDTGERRRWCDELERLLELHDHPPGRIDLAMALYYGADGDLRTLRRAHRHAQRGLAEVSDPRAVDVARTLLRRLDRAIARLDPDGNLDEPSEPEIHVDDVNAFLADPAGEAFARIRTQLMPAAAPGVDMPAVMARFALGSTARSVPTHDTGSQLDALDVLDVHVTSQSTIRTQPGVLAARVALVARLARASRRSVDEVRAITAEAIEALSAVPPAARSILLREIAVVWLGDDGTHDVVRDSKAAIDLLTRCVELEGREARATDQTLALLAEARRSGAGGRHPALREARRLQELRVARHRNAGDGDALAGALCDLAEVEIDFGAAGQQRGEQALRAAVPTASGLPTQARIAAVLATVQTQLACALQASDRLEPLQAAAAACAAIDVTLLDKHRRDAVALHQTCCEAAMASLRGDRGEAIERWRSHLRAIEPTAPADVVASAQHHLALALLSDADSAATIEAGLAVASSAALVRTITDHPLAHHQTAMGVGRALLAAFKAGHLDAGVAANVAGEARVWLERAITAARECEAADVLAGAALVLTELELATAIDDTVADRVDRAWSIVAEASPHLIFDLGSREREASAALQVTASLAYRRAARVVPAATANGVGFTLDGADAELVASWLIRAQEPARRPLRARLARSPAVSARRWTDWVAALADRDEIRIAEALADVRTVAPGFLDSPTTAESTWRWLLPYPDAAAIAFVLTESGALVVILRIDPDGQRRTHVLGLDLPPSPAGTVLDVLFRGELPGAEAADGLESIVGWLQRHVIAPTEVFLGHAPGAVLWCPDPRFRRVAPSAIWPGRPVAITANLALPDLSASPARHRSTLLALADPADRAKDRRLDLRGRGQPAMASLAKAAAELGTVWSLGSVGTTFGRAALGERLGVHDTPASAGNLLAEAGEHDVIMVLAHGQVDPDGGAALLCVDEHGAIDPLDVTALARTPDRFAGAVVILLSCDAGRTGDSLAEPGGVAGTLISAGARCVVAPLWTVRIDVAVHVGIAVLRGIARGAAPWEVLADLSIDVDDDAPALGGPPIPQQARRAQARVQRLAFVTWVG